MNTEPGTHPMSTTIELSVEQMHCGSCVKRVTEALKAIPGIFDVEVDLKAGRVRVDATIEPDPGSMIAALGIAGYPARQTANAPALVAQLATQPPRHAAKVVAVADASWDPRADTPRRSRFLQALSMGENRRSYSCMAWVARDGTGRRPPHRYRRTAMRRCSSICSDSAIHRSRGSSTQWNDMSKRCTSRSPSSVTS